MDQLLTRAWSEAIEQHTGSRPRRASRVLGGDICLASKIELEDGAQVFCKRLVGGSEVLAREAQGLQWLAQTDSLAIPRVLGQGAVGTVGYVLLTWIEMAPRGCAPSPRAQEKLGHQLAQMHMHMCPGFGADASNFIGPLAQDNRALATWPEFFRERRLLPMTQLCSRRGRIDQRLRQRLEKLASRIEARVGPTEPPSRVHGDLWSGNYCFDADEIPHVFDPSAYGGHREVDLAMMHLFGGFDRLCFAAYEHTYPLAPGADRRRPLYQIYPLLVHVALFGASYRPQLEAALATQE